MLENKSNTDRISQCEACTFLEDSMYCPYGHGINGNGICRLVWENMEDCRKEAIDIRIYNRKKMYGTEDQEEVPLEGSEFDSILKDDKSSPAMLVRQLANRQIKQIIELVLDNNDLCSKDREELLRIIKEDRWTINRNDRIALERFCKRAKHLKEYIRQLEF